MPEFTYRVSTSEALAWDLYKASLNYQLTDHAEAAAREQHGPAFDDLEVDTRVTIEGNEFVVTFAWGEDQPTLRTTRVSFDIVTRRAGTAEVTAPAGTDLSALLQDHLAKNGDALDEAALPAGVTLDAWTLEPGQHRLDVDWEEKVV